MLLSLGYSPCPNDTYIFGALALGLVTVPGVEFDIRLEDVETLNQLAARGELDVAKASYAAIVGGLRETYELMTSGGALGRGCGPLIVSRNPIDPNDLPGCRIVTPGRNTTACLLTRLFAPGADLTATLPFERIMPAVAAGEFDAGVIIHESRFTYPVHGLRLVIDLGEWWESTTGHPIPLGGILARKSLGADAIRRIETGIVASLDFARTNREAIQPYIERHAQEMSRDVQDQHIGLYVNDFSRDLGGEGWAAVDELTRRATEVREK